jgi:hypothetical protein
VHAFIFSDLFSQSFCGSLHLLGVDLHARQFLQQLTALLETDHGTHGADHACERRRLGGVFYPHMLITRIEPVSAPGAVIVGAFQSQGTQHAYEVLGSACDITRFLPTSTTQVGTGFIGKVGVETLLNGVGREP